MPHESPRAIELDGMLARKLKNIQQFRAEQDTTWALANSAVLAVRASIDIAALHGCASPTDAHRVMMWYTVVDYEIESFFLILDRKLGEGVALLRMAAELARDMACINKNPANLHIWLKREKKEAQKDYRKTFRFDEADPLQAYVLKLYDLASGMGVHGHVLTSVNMKPVDQSPDGDFVSLAVPDLAVYQTLELWLAAFFPINELFAAGFDWELNEPMKITRSNYNQMMNLFSGAFVAYRKGLAGMNADALGPVQ